MGKDCSAGEYVEAEKETALFGQQIIAFPSHFLKNAPCSQFFRESIASDLG